MASSSLSESFALNVLIAFEKRQEIALAAPDLHGIALHKAIGVFAGTPFWVSAISTRCEWISPPSLSRWPD